MVVKCPLCQTPISIKDNGVYSSALCHCRIVIYYYHHGNNIEITKKEYIKGKGVTHNGKRTLQMATTQDMQSPSMC